jgi:hypothetical protein
MTTFSMRSNGKRMATIVLRCVVSEEKAARMGAKLGVSPGRAVDLIREAWQAEVDNTGPCIDHVGPPPATEGDIVFPGGHGESER